MYFMPRMIVGVLLIQSELDLKFPNWFRIFLQVLVQILFLAKEAKELRLHLKDCILHTAVIYECCSCENA